MRDDFAQPIKNTLAARSGYACCNPGCRAATSGPQAQEGKAVNVGVAAHISGAAIGGPRFDPNLSPAQRASIINGIWLCQTCAKVIDADQTRYSVALLYQWKLESEHAAHQELGKPKISDRPIGDRPLVPSETVRIVHNQNLSRWGMGTSGMGDPIMLVHFYGHITEVAGKQIRVVVAEIPDPPKQEMIVLCDGHDCRRPQVLQPYESADITVTFMIPPVDNLNADGTWVSPVVFVDQFGNRHELLNCVFRKPRGPETG